VVVMPDAPQTGAFGGLSRRLRSVLTELIGLLCGTPALMMGMEDIILDRISFGGVKELQEIYFDYI
jgi:hypothetical protein